MDAFISFSINEQPHHYNLVGRALLWTLQGRWGNDGKEEIRSAWTNSYAILSGY